jgi:peptide/nickel transport system substrate-binding protein
VRCGPTLGRARLALVAVGLAGVLLAPGAGRLDAADPRGELRVAIPWTPENLDPTMNLSSIRATVGVSLFDSLVGRDRDNRIVPELAESWRLLNDTTWQFKLRRGVVFHDGEPFNAEAVRFTIQRVLDPEQKSPNRANIGEIVRVEAVDDVTVNLVTGKPYAALLNRLIDFPILPPRYTAEKGNQGMALRPVGTGPYRFVSLVKDDQMVVEAFDRHGEVDLITTVPPTLARELERVAGLKVQRVPSTWQIYLGLNALKKPLSDLRVRQALNYASDVDTLVRTVLDGNGRRQIGPFTPVMFGYDASVKGYGYDPARARQLLAEAGYPDGLEVTLDSPAGRYQGDKEIAEGLGGQWQKAGLRPKVRTAEWGSYFKRYLGKEFPDAYLLGLGGPMQDGDELFNLVSSKGRGLYYKNEKVDALFDLGRNTLEPGLRRKIYADLARAMVEDAAWVFLLQQVDIYATRERVSWTPRADQWLQLHTVTLR